MITSSPLALSGESTLDNCQVLCRPCHRGEGAKTTQDVKRIAKAKRSYDRHAGITKPKQSIPSPPKAEKQSTKTVLPPRRLYEARS
jgi:hypothetical protein